MFWSSCFCYEIVVVFIDEIEWCIDVLKCSKSCYTCDCRMEIITKLFHLCIVRTTMIQWLIAMFIVLPDRKFSTDSNHTTTTEAIMTYVPHAVRTSCWKSNSWLTSSRRMRSDKTFACLLFFYQVCCWSEEREMPCAWLICWSECELWQGSASHGQNYCRLLQFLQL